MPQFSSKILPVLLDGVNNSLPLLNAYTGGRMDYLCYSSSLARRRLGKNNNTKGMYTGEGDNKV